MNHTALFYDTSSILNELQITFPLFKAVLVISGTDYNYTEPNNIITHEENGITKCFQNVTLVSIYNLYIKFYIHFQNVICDQETSNTLVKIEPSQNSICETQDIYNFYNWVNDIYKYNIDVEQLLHICSLFDIENNKELQLFYNSTTKMMPIQTTKLIKFLYNYNFIFL
jgi:hypothetical protein